MLAELDGQAIAATLYLHDDDNVYAYLGGLDYAYQRVRPSNAVIYETMLWAKRLGKKRLILGGGYHEKDGIFRFKSTFSPLRARFQIYRKVHMAEQYAALCEAWETYYGVPASSDGYFPAYRFEPSAAEVYA
jgi:lipid II:glycine glycyltransferase (peptidoglycan interpeptide bridge formation enzyme)